MVVQVALRRRKLDCSISKQLMSSDDGHGYSSILQWSSLLLLVQVQVGAVDPLDPTKVNTDCRTVIVRLVQ